MSIVDSVEQEKQEENPRELLLNVSNSITRYLETHSVETERREFVAYLSIELESLRYQQSCDALARTVTGKSASKDQPETRTHVIDEIPEEEEEDRCFKTDFVTSTPKNTKNTGTQRI